MWNPSSALITGASSGLGESFARKLAARGTSLVIVARRAERLEALANELTHAHGVKVEFFSLDLSLREAPRQLYEFCRARNLQIDLLINNAGIGEYRDFLRTPLELHLKAIDLNARSLVELTYLFVQDMRLRGQRSSVLNVSSVASFQPIPKYATYSSTKSFVRVFSNVLRHELKRSAVSVHCLCPGGTATEFLSANNQVLGRHGHRALMSVDAVTDAALEGLRRNQALIIPGIFNKLSVLLTLLLPQSWSLSLAHRAMRLAVLEKDLESSKMDS